MGFNPLDAVAKYVKQVANPPKKPPLAYPSTGRGLLANKQEFDQRENYIAQWRADPDLANAPIESIYDNWNNPIKPSPSYAPIQPRKRQTVAAPSGPARRGGGGGGGGNGAALAQSQLDALMQLLGSGAFTAAPETGVRDAINARQAGVNTATQQDLASANTAYDALDNYLRSNLSNPYANVKLQQANVGPDYNEYLQTQGVQPLNRVTSNPDDSYGGFQNVLALLGANQQGMNQSTQTGSQQARAASTTGINALDNAYNDAIKTQLAALSQKEYENQQGLDAEKRQALMQILPLLAAGATAPADWLSRMGITPGGGAPAADPADPLNWKGIAAGIANGSIRV